MKVMMFTGALPELPSGVGDYVHEVHKALKGRVELVLVTSDAREIRPELFDGAVVHRVAKTWGPGDLPAIADLIRAERPDVFHQQYPSLMGGPTNRSFLSNALPFWLKALFRGTPLVTTVHEWGERRLRWRARAFGNVLLSDGVITITSKDAAILRRWNRGARRVALVSNIPVAPRPPRRAHGPRIVSFFGLIDRMKGLEMFIEAATLLGGEGYRFQVLGGFRPQSVPYHASLLDKVRAKGLADSFLFPGHLGREEVAGALAASDCCLLPFEEGVSERRTSLLAALVQGTPVVTTTGPYLPDEYRGIQGLALVSPRDPAAMAERVRALCERGPVPGEFDRLVRGISHEALAAGHLEAYRAALAGRRGRA